MCGNNVNEALRERFEKTMEFVPKQGTLLEIGSYPFIVTEELIRMGYNVTGIDKNKTDKTNIVQCDIENQLFPFKDNTFDIILCMEIIEHLGVNPIHAIKEANRVLKKDGIMVLTTPNILRLQNLKSIILKGKQLETLKSLSQVEWFGYIGHIREYTKNELIDILKYCNFGIVDSCMYEGSKHKLTRIIGSLFPSLRTAIILSCKKVDHEVTVGNA